MADILGGVNLTGPLLHSWKSADNGLEGVEGSFNPGDAPAPPMLSGSRLITPFVGREPGTSQNEVRRQMV